MVVWALSVLQMIVAKNGKYQVCKFRRFAYMVRLSCVWNWTGLGLTNRMKPDFFIFAVSECEGVNFAGHRERFFLSSCRWRQGIDMHPKVCRRFELEWYGLRRGQIFVSDVFLMKDREVWWSVFWLIVVWFFILMNGISFFCEMVLAFWGLVNPNSNNREVRKEQYKKQQCQLT